MIHKGDIGGVISADVGEDISGATVRTMKYRKPNGATGSWGAVADGTTAVKFTTTLATDLDQAGSWKGQLYLEVGGWKGHSDIFDFVVGDNL